MYTRLYRPAPAIGLGLALRNIATSAIDISDGLLADLHHILVASKKGAVINIGKLPMSAAVNQQPDAVDIALTSGDDYELCFTVSPGKKIQLENDLKKKFKISCIGKITDGNGIIWQRADGGQYHPKGKAYQHF